jgi:hypothetical protein
MGNAALHKGHPVEFEKIVIDKRFVSEGAAIADVNRDGKLDILAGNYWYEASNWAPHPIEPEQQFDARNGYSNSFIVYASDVNRDGWPDEILIGMPGEKAVWRENPGKKSVYWKEHLLYPSACNESPAFADLLDDHKPVVVMGYDDKYVGWFEPGKNMDNEFICHTISHDGQPGGYRYSHGLGVGDINGDGKNEVICTGGWWEQPSDPRSSPWKFTPAALGPDCAQMIIYDVNGDGIPDAITSSAHNYGVWWWEQKKRVAEPVFVQHVIDKTISETHSIVLADINGDGVNDIVTGKRLWAHGPNGDPGSDEPAMLVWYELQRGKGQVHWIRHDIDNDSGVGTEFVVKDINKDGLPDIIVSNKKGVFLFFQKKPVQ